jgi:alpha-amylase/alpha-mannosidase (GH57 family)
VVGCGRGLGSGGRLGWDGDMMERQGVAGDMTFRHSDRDVARTGTWHDEDGDTKAWQDVDEDREAGNWR